MLSLVSIENKTQPHVDTYNILRDDGAIVGICGLRHTPTKSEEAPDDFESHIFYETLERYRGKGYATEALRILLDKARALNFPEILLTIKDQNLGSQKVAEANGAQRINSRTSPRNNILYHQYKISL